MRDGGQAGAWNVVTDERLADVDHAEDLEWCEEVCGVDGLVLVQDGTAATCVVQHDLTEFPVGLALIVVLMEEWLKEKDKRRVVLNASGKQMSAFQEERKEVKAVGKATADVLQKKYVWKRFATQIRYVRRKGLFPRQVSLIDLRQPVSIDFSPATTEQQNHGVNNTRELGMLGGGLQGMTQPLVVLIAFIFPI